MQPSHAEIARTLAAGGLVASAHIACRPGPFPVRHVTDSEGRVLLLAPAGSALTRALHPIPGQDDTALVLDITDVPPRSDAPSHGRVWVAGWAVALAGDEARAAAVEYCEMDATADLLDIGAGQVLHRMEVVEVRLEHHGMTFDVDPDEYALAVPDPLRADEFDLIADLADHHVPELGAYLRRRLGPAVRPGEQPVIVRLDRYGFSVRLGDRRVRLAFPRPVHDRADLAQLLHPVLCHRCATATTADAA